MQSSIKKAMHDGACVIELSPSEGRPTTLDEGVLASLERTLDGVEREVPRVVVVRGGSDKYFCVGADLSVLRETNAATIVPWVLAGHRVLNRMEDLPCPVIARVSGYAMGGGLELALACDLIVATESAVFAQSEAGLGFIPGWGGTLRLPERVGASVAKRLFFTGDKVTAAEAERIGLADFVGTPEAVDAEISRIAGAVTSQSAHALRAFKKILGDRRRCCRAESAAIEAELSRGCLADDEARRRIDAFFEQRKK